MSEKNNPHSEELNRVLAEGSDIHGHLIQKPEDFQALLNWEESMVSAIQNQLISEHPLFEALDIAKALQTVERNPIPVPPSLLQYVQSQLDKPARKEGIIIRIYENGLSAITSFLNPQVWTQHAHTAPIMRTGSDTESKDQNFVIFQEKLEQGFSFYYQIVKEKADEVFLSIRAQSNSETPFHQVTLKREGRFILSRNVERDGQLSFSGLKAGNYTIEFQGDSFSKAVDLLLLAG